MPTKRSKPKPKKVGKGVVEDVAEKAIRYAISHPKEASAAVAALGAAGYYSLFKGSKYLYNKLKK